MRCILCGKPHKGEFIKVYSMFELCVRCVGHVRENEQVMKYGHVMGASSFDIDRLKNGLYSDKTICLDTGEVSNELY